MCEKSFNFVSFFQCLAVAPLCVNQTVL